jgi:hypothetical protein
MAFFMQIVYAFLASAAMKISINILIKKEEMKLGVFVWRLADEGEERKNIKSTTKYPSCLYDKFYFISSRWSPLLWQFSKFF